MAAPASRPPPFVAPAEIAVGTAPLDRAVPLRPYLHAVAFSLTTVAYFGRVVPFAVLVALCRLVPGRHYPSDVPAGAGPGTVFALVALQAAAGLDAPGV